MSGGIHQSLDESFKKGKWVSFPDGGCSCCHGKCNRIHEDGEVDFFEPM